MKRLAISLLTSLLCCKSSRSSKTLAAVSCEISLIHPYLNVRLQSLCMDTNEAAGCSKPLAKNSSSQKTKKFVPNSILMSSNKCASLLASSNLVSKFKKCASLISLHQSKKKSAPLASIKLGLRNKKMCTSVGQVPTLVGKTTGSGQ